MNITVLTSIYADKFQLSVIMSLLQSSHKITGWIIDEREPKPIMKKLISNISKGRGGYIFIMALKHLFKRKEFLNDVYGLIRNSGAPFHLSKNISAPETIDRIRSFNSDLLVLIGGFGIIKDPILNLSRYGVLSYHHGDLKKYRGQPPGFWELYNNESEARVTIQKLSEGIDCGEPVLEISVPIKEKDTLASLQKRMYSLSADLMLKAINFLATNPSLKKYDNYGKIYTLPNLRQWLIFNMKILLRQINLSKQKRK